MDAMGTCAATAAVTVTYTAVLAAGA